MTAERPLPVERVLPLVPPTAARAVADRRGVLAPRFHVDDAVLATGIGPFSRLAMRLGARPR